MSWTDDARWHFFRSGDPAFLERYANEGLQGMLDGQDGLVRQLRQALDGISRLVPSAAHVWRGWNSDPLVVIGRLKAVGARWQVQRSPQVPRSGLCQVQDELRVFADPEVVADFDPDWAGDWVPWTGGMVCLSGSFQAPDWQPQERLHDFLRHVDERLSAPPGSGPEVAPQLRAALGEPPGLACLYPRLEDMLPGAAPAPRGPTRPPGTAVQAAAEAFALSEAPSAPPAESPAPPPANDWIGVLFREGPAAPLQTLILDRAAMQAWHAVNRAQRDVLALAWTQTKQDAEQVIGKLLQVEGSLAVPNFPQTGPLPGGLGSSYVYLYFNACMPGWNDVFYVGVGTDPQNPPRDESHLRTVLRKRRNGAPLVGGKERAIADALDSLRPTLPGRDIADYRAAVAAHGTPARDLFRRVFTGLTSLQAHAAEHYLIYGWYGAYGVSNRTNGNRVLGNLGCGLLVRPAAVRHGPPAYRQAWHDACTDFLRAGLVTGPVAATLAALPLVPLATAFDALHQPGGRLHGLIEPEVALSAGQAPVAGTLHVRSLHGNAATATYRVIGRLAPGAEVVTRSGAAPFRIELNASRTEPGVGINLRVPAGAANGAGFANHWAAVNLRLPAPLIPRNTASRQGLDAYVKPFAPGGDGDEDVFFPIEPPWHAVHPDTALSWPDWHPGGPLSITDAIRLVLTHLV